MGARAYGGGIALGVAAGWNIANVGAVAPALSRDYRVSLTTIGLLTTALFLMHMLMQVPAGRAADRFGARPTGLVALAVLLLANALLVIAPDPVLAILARALCGVGTGLGFIAGSDYVRAGGGSAFAQGIYGGATVGAPGLGLAIIPQLSGPLGFRAPYVSALAVAAVGLAWLLVAPSPPPGGRGNSAGSLAGLFRDRRLYRFAAVHTASFALSVVAGNWVVTLLEKHGVGHTAAGAAGSLTLLLGLITRPLGGWVFRRRPRLVGPVVALSLLAGSLGLALLALPLPFAALALAAALVGLAAGIPFAFAFAGSAAARIDAPGAAVGFVNGWAALAILAGTPLVGLSFSLAGRGRLGFAVLAALCLLAVCFIPQRGRDVPPAALSS